jgi:phosphoglycerate dehydrogenase-like enzyme
MTSLHVHYPNLREGEHARALRTALPPEVRLSDAAEERLEDVAVLVEGLPTRELLARLPALRAVVVPWAGVGAAAREVLAERPGLEVYNLHHNALPVVEHAVGLLIAAARSIVPADRALRAGDWRYRYDESDDPLLAGATAVIVGAGAIGRRVARVLEALGMQARLVGRTARAGVSGVAELRELLPVAAALVLALPLTPESEGLVGAEELALLPDGAVLVNVGRGALCDEAALYEALRSGRIRAGLDVWYRYPEDEAARSATPPSAYAFGELPNVVLSPHRAGRSSATERLRAAHLAEVLRALARGAEPPGRVDLARGY